MLHQFRPDLPTLHHTSPNPASRLTAAVNQQHSGQAGGLVGQRLPILLATQTIRRPGQAAGIDHSAGQRASIERDSKLQQAGGEESGAGAASRVPGGLRKAPVAVVPRRSEPQSDRRPQPRPLLADHLHPRWRCQSCLQYPAAAGCACCRSPPQRKQRARQQELWRKWLPVGGRRWWRAPRRASCRAGAASRGRLTGYRTRWRGPRAAEALPVVPGAGRVCVEPASQPAAPESLPEGRADWARRPGAA